MPRKPDRIEVIHAFGSSWTKKSYDTIFGEMAYFKPLSKELLMCGEHNSATEAKMADEFFRKRWGLEK